MARLNLQTLPTVAPTQGPSPRFSLDSRGAFGEQLAATAGAAVREAGEVAVKMKDRADLVAVEEAETAFQQEVNDRLYGKDGKGFLTRQGHDAVRDSTPTLEALAKRRDEIEKALADEGQRIAFRKRTNGTLVQSQRQVEAHVGGQIQVVEGQAYEARRAAALDTIANGYRDPAVVARERQNHESLAMLEAKRRGLEGAGTYPPPRESPAGQFLEAWRADTVKTVLNRLLADKDVARAKALLAQPIVAGGPTAQETIGSDADKFTAAINHVAEQVEAFDVASRAVTGARDKSTGRVDEAKARAGLADAPPAIRREAHLNLESLLNAEKESWARTVGEHWNAAKTAYQGGPDGTGPKGLQAIDGRTSSWLRANAPDAWRSMIEWARADAEHAKNPVPTPAQEAAFTAIAVRVIDHPEEFVNLDGPAIESQYLTQVSPRDRRALLGHILQGKTGAHRPDETLPTNIVQEILSKGRPGGGGASIFPAKGDNPGQWPPEKAQLFNVIFRDLLAFQNQTRATTGKPPSPEEFSKRIDGWMQRGEVQGSGTLWDDTGVPRVKAETDPRYQGKEFTPEQPPKPAMPKTKAADYRKLLGADRKATIPQTPAVLEYLWAIDPDNPKRDPTAQPPPEFFQPFDADKAAADTRARVGTLVP